jgi:hypothetical protein|tara:strand:+ start:1921 stop:2292 length:372 start_codon:yes stop_codon:yes gene_type:complete
MGEDFFADIAAKGHKAVTRYATFYNEGVEAETMIDGVLVNPENIPEAGIPHHERTQSEIMMWWRLPYIVGQDKEWSVYSLDGGANDRPSFVGQGRSLKEAVKIAKGQFPQSFARVEFEYNRAG